MYTRAHCWNSLRSHCHFMRYVACPMNSWGQLTQASNTMPTGFSANYVTDRFRRCVKRSSQLLAEDSILTMLLSFSLFLFVLPLDTIGRWNSRFFSFSCIIANQGKWGLRFRIKGFGSHTEYHTRNLITLLHWIDKIRATRTTKWNSSWVIYLPLSLVYFYFNFTLFSAINK
jgi:hypothetical protein